MRRLRWLPLLFTPLLLSGCPFVELPAPLPLGPGTVQFNNTDVTLAAGMAELQPATVDTLSSSVNLGRLNVSGLQRVYELETPANTDFSFTVVARGGGNIGATRLSLAHAASNGLTPQAGVETIAAEGMVLEGAGMSNRGDWLDVTGDGFARVTVRGNISADQVLVVQVPRNNTTIDIGVRIRIGNPSAINLVGGGASSARPGMASQTIYSSDSWQFGLPSLAVSGDRVSVAAYDGDPTQQTYTNRRRQWLQHDSATGTVTGGNATCSSGDTGFWRDQEIAAQGNVLSVAYTGDGNVRMDISLDRGATFPIQQVVTNGSFFGQRLVQAAIAADYKLGCLYWQSSGSINNPTSQLVLVEATPTAFDANNTPTGYSFAAPVTVHNVGRDVTPLLMHMAYSNGGDLAVGYGYTSITPSTGWTVISSSKFRCAVRRSGQSNFTDVELDREDNVVPCDPHVSVLGSGPTMEIFYTYEKSDGIHVRYSSNGGVSFSTAAFIPSPGANMPSIHARMQGGQKRVDLLYIAPTAWGNEVHNVHWDNFVLGGPSPALYRVTQATAVAGSTPPYPGMPAGYTITSAAWFGYDAVVKGDDVVVVVHEVTCDSYEYYFMQGAPGGTVAFAGGGTPPPPTILLPGMTGSVAAPNAAHRNQLKILTLD